MTTHSTPTFHQCSKYDARAARRKVEQEVAFVPYHLVDKDGKASAQN